MLTARRYVRALAADLEPTFEQIVKEHDRSLAAILAVTGERELLERSPMLRTTIRLRNLYLDPLHLAQLALLVRRRETAGDEAVLDAVHHSINAIAAGLQSTG